MLPPEWQKLQRLLVVRLDNIGDMVMMSPALRTLRRHLPTAEITLMASPAGTQVAPLLPWIDEVLTLRAVWQDASGTLPFSPERERELVEQLQARQFEAMFIFTSFSQSPYPPAFVAYGAGIPIRVGQSKEFGGSILSHWITPLPDTTHQVDRNLHLLASVGFLPAGQDLELLIPPEIQHQSDCRLAELGIAPEQPFLVLAPGASCAARRYEIDRYAEVAKILTTQTGWPLVVLGSDRETELFAPIFSDNSGNSVISLVGQTSILEMAAVIHRSRLVIANDSGPMHIADALARPMVILFSGTELEEQWQPRKAPTQLLRRPTDCSPCYRFNCPYQMECLDIPPVEVAAVCLRLLQQAGIFAAEPIQVVPR